MYLDGNGMSGHAALHILAVEKAEVCHMFLKVGSELLTAVLANPFVSVVTGGHVRFLKFPQ